MLGFAQIPGYMTITFQPGDNLFANPLFNGDTHLSFLISNAPPGTTVSAWNPSEQRFDETSTFDGHSWSIDMQLFLGTGYLLHTDTAFTVPFVGFIYNFNGQPYNDGPLIPPPPYAGPDGLFLLSPLFPTTLSSNQPPFLFMFGRAPQDGESVTTLDPLTQLYHTTTFVNGAWNNGDAVVTAGSAAFFNIGPVVITPEPSSGACCLLGAAVLATFQYARRPALASKPLACR